MLAREIERWRNPQTTNDPARAAAELLVAEAGSTDTRDLSREQVANVAARLKARYTNTHTRYRYTTGLRWVLRLLAEEYGAPINLARAVTRAIRPSPRAVIATEEERTAILTAAPAHLHLWLLLCSDLAMRSGTAARIAPEHYDPQRREVTFRTKFGVPQTLPVTDAIAAIFASVGDTYPSRPYVRQLRARKFTTQSTQWIADRLMVEFAQLRRDLGITRKLTAHDLRRTTAVRTLDITSDLRVVQALLGHRDLSTTLYYLDHRNTPVPRALLETAKLNAKKGHP